LDSIADVWLEHDRPIRRPIDDSVVRVMAGRPVMIRLARGHAPLPLAMESEQPILETSIALSNAAQAVLGPHIGDLDTVAARQRFVDQVADLSRLYGIGNGQLVCDCHPEYFTTQWVSGYSTITLTSLPAC
jgi:hydrogenase maturation protein HypF